ncbi:MULTISPECIES: site-specific integrase [unclassified Rhizobium]|uniref:tyrosine-type recombinase/integrase n=1 Tax=unclassified Rhizobium TaxID=2613769 RepID=UPI00161D8929|nr:MULTISPECIES: site-specific integrase [unclassified Rhizobium]MBB3289920.1 integrase [Rhizobium sp. BK252]MBB3404149.1 integrase [Rhizobium sp. BK289]MBB3417248.1 integrase [Rhizobium sp. BK284]MBB3485125.1 integrase [Rhizobium sp. BK347]
MPLKLVQRHGGKNWYIRGTVRGIAVDETTGTDDKKRAEEIRIKREAELLDRSIHGRSKTATFLEASVMYLEQGGSSRFVDKIAKHFGTKPLHEIDQLAIDRAARKLYPDASPSTLNRQVYTPISAILKLAAKYRLCAPFDIARPKQPKGRVRWITTDEANALIGACSPHLKPLVTFLLYTGARLSEALYLDWKDVDLMRAHVAFLDTKTGIDRGVPLHPRVVVALGNMKHRTGAVFLTNRGKPYEVKEDDEGGGQIKTGFKGACRRAGIKDFTPHDCRHTWATWHYIANRDLIALKELGGWTSEKMVLRYAHINVSNLASSINNLPWGNIGEVETGIGDNERKAK